MQRSPYLRLPPSPRARTGVARPRVSIFLMLRHFVLFLLSRSRLSLAVASSAALLACGQRGPLYLRESPPPGVKPAPSAPLVPGAPAAPDRGAREK